MRNTQKRVKQVIVNSIVAPSGPTSTVFVLDNDDNLFELRSRKIDKTTVDGKSYTEIELYWFRLPTLPEIKEDVAN